MLAIIATLVAIVYDVDLLGTPLRLVHVLTMVPLGMAAGIALARAVPRLRAPDPAEWPAALATLFAIMFGVDLLGTPLRLVDVLMMVPLSMAAGIVLAAADAPWRAPPPPEPPAA